MNAMFDINVVLDIVGRREPFAEAAEAAYLHAVERSGKPFLAVHAYATLYYLLGTASAKRNRKEAMDWIFNSFSVAAIGKAELAAARSYTMQDFEDAMVAAAAESSGCDVIVTRNEAHFSGSPIPAVSPEVFTAMP